jgi:hypothetical protein
MGKNVEILWNESTEIQMSVRTDMLDGKCRHRLYKLKNATSLAGAAAAAAAAATARKITATIATTKPKITASS